MATSNTGALARSQDGANWTDISGNIGADIFRSVVWENVLQHWVVVRETGVVYISADEGNTWINKLNLRWINNRVYKKAAAGNGLIIIRNDFGQTWER